MMLFLISSRPLLYRSIGFDVIYNRLWTIDEIGFWIESITAYPVIEENFRLVCHTFVPEQPHGVIDDERGEQIAVNVDPGALQTLPENGGCGEPGHSSPISQRITHIYTQNDRRQHTQQNIKLLLEEL